VHGHPEIIIEIQVFVQNAVIEVIKHVDGLLVVLIAPAGNSAEILGVDPLRAFSSCRGSVISLYAVLVVHIVVVIVEGILDDSILNEGGMVEIIDIVRELGLVDAVRASSSQLVAAAKVFVAVVLVAKAPLIAIEVLGSHALSALLAVSAEGSCVVVHSEVASGVKLIAVVESGQFHSVECRVAILGGDASDKQ